MIRDVNSIIGWFTVPIRDEKKELTSVHFEKVLTK